MACNCGDDKSGLLDEVLSTKNAPFVIFYSGRYLLKTRKNLCKCSRVSGTCDRRELVIFRACGSVVPGLAPLHNQHAPIRTTSTLR